MPRSTALRRVEPHPEQTPPLPSRPRPGCPRRSLPLFLSPSSPSSKQSPRSPGVPRSLPRSPLVSQLLTVPPILSVPLVPSVPSVPWPDMARAAEPERRLLAIYTGGTIGMRSERGGESATAPEGAASGVAVGWGRLGAVPHSSGQRPHTRPTHRVLATDVPAPGQKRGGWDWTSVARSARPGCVWLAAVRASTWNRGCGVSRRPRTCLPSSLAKPGGGQVFRGRRL